MLLDLSGKINISTDDLIFDMYNLGFLKLLLTFRYFIDVTMLNRSFSSNPSNKVFCGE